MKEWQIRKKVIESLEDKRWTCWYPWKSRFKKEQDIFGIADLLCGRKKELKLIQLTSYPNISARAKKVKEGLKKYGFQFEVEVWGYNKKDHKFRIVKIKLGE